MKMIMTRSGRKHTNPTTWIPVRDAYMDEWEQLIKKLLDQPMKFTSTLTNYGSLRSEIKKPLGKAGTVKATLHLHPRKDGFNFYVTITIQSSSESRGSFRSMEFSTEVMSLGRLPEELYTFDAPDGRGKPYETVFIRCLMALKG